MLESGILEQTIEIWNCNDLRFNIAKSFYDLPVLIYTNNLLEGESFNAWLELFRVGVPV